MDAVEELKAEREYFDAQRAELLKDQKDKFLLIKGQRLVGTFTTFKEAYERGVSEFGQEPFLVKQLVEHEAREIQPALYLGLVGAGL